MQSQAPKIFTALDFPSPAEAEAMFKRLRSIHPYFKVGLELFAQIGLEGVKRYVDAGAKIFLDLKFHDIPHTVEQVIRQVSTTGAVLTNIHISGGEAMARAALAGLPSKNGPQLIGVTVLTSLSDADIKNIGWSLSASDQALSFAQQAKSWGLHGVVCSAHELVGIRAACGKNFLTIVPGIRSATDSAHDQKRTLSAREAAKAGADYLVIGRPITRSAKPEEALVNFLGEL